jgi:quinohemoprotein ethanol dehydrogenase
MFLEERGRGARGRARLAASLLILVVMVVVAGCGGGSKKAATTSSAATPTTGATSATGTTSTTAAAMPATAPAFTADQLSAPAGADWLTNGSSLTNDRFSSLTQINDGNVQGLRGNWMTHLRGSGTALKYSAEGTALEYQGVLYETTGADDVFAVDVDSGQIKWEYKANLPASLASVVCCGWDNRGAALGDGKLYLGQLDGKLVALDQATGRPVWTTAVASPKQAYTITMPPLYYDGKVYVGPVGADYGGRGYLDAYDATTGKRIWRFYNVPGPGQAGHETWPKSNDAWKRGGATVWSSPSVDPQLGLLYYSTGNAGNDWDGRNRPGDNLYSSSIVALDTKTGKVRWHYQQVHHDVWDFDSPSPTVLIDTTVNGTPVHGIAQPSKTGYVYFRSRRHRCRSTGRRERRRRSRSRRCRRSARRASRRRC